MAPHSEAGGIPWVELYGVVGAVSAKEPDVFVDLLTTEGSTQTADESRAPAWTVLGTSGSNKVYWVALKRGLPLRCLNSPI